MGKVSVQSLALEGEENNEQLKVLSDEELQELDIEELQYKRAVIEEQLKDLKPNMAAVEEYKRKVCVVDLQYRSLVISPILLCVGEGLFGSCF